MSEFSKYFDCNATTPMSELARDVWVEACAEFWQNPSSLYREAALAKQRLEDAREDLADLLGVEDPERLVFTSGATEANNAILQFLASRGNGDIAVSAIEHPSVDAAALYYFGEDRIREIAVDPASGVIDLSVLEEMLLRGGLEAVSIMAANNETGVIQPWSEAAGLCREAGVWFHTDAAQWFGKLPGTDLGQCDFVTGSGHKFGGGKGVGFLVLPAIGADLFHGLVGGPQEEGHRAGTENVPAVLAMVAALEEKESVIVESRSGEGREVFEARVKDEIGAEIIGLSGERLWNTSMILLPHSKNVKWVARLSQSGFSVSTGSACSAGKGNPSRVMEAMGLDFDQMGRVLRISGGWDSSVGDWEQLAAAVASVAADLGA